VPLHQSLWLFNQEVDFMDFARIRRDVFPSMHVAISFVAWLYAYRNSKKLFWILSPLILSLWLSTLYLRYHYLIDVVAGLILAPLSFVLANWLFRRWGDIPVSFAIPWRWAERLPWLSKSAALEGPEKVGEGR
jgi:membrane-associated phospholipid phosphatase